MTYLRSDHHKPNLGSLCRGEVVGEEESRVDRYLYQFVLGLPSNRCGLRHLYPIPTTIANRTMRCSMLFEGCYGHYVKSREIQSLDKHMPHSINSILGTYSEYGRY
jgi:hypothetical protein